MKKFRIIIDVLMYIVFIVLMGHHITENKIHKILGIVISSINISSDVFDS